MLGPESVGSARRRDDSRPFAPSSSRRRRGLGERCRDRRLHLRPQTKWHALVLGDGFGARAEPHPTHPSSDCSGRWQLGWLGSVRGCYRRHPPGVWQRLRGGEGRKAVLLGTHRQRRVTGLEVRLCQRSSAPACDHRGLERGSVRFRPFMRHEIGRNRVVLGVERKRSARHRNDRADTAAGASATLVSSLHCPPIAQTP